VFDKLSGLYEIYYGAHKITGVLIVYIWSYKFSSKQTGMILILLSLFIVNKSGILSERVLCNFALDLMFVKCRYECSPILQG
jgi:hypothetical protein